MVKNLCRWVWSHRKTSLFLILFMSFVLLNVLAFMHARAMTCFAPTGKGTARPESLSTLEKVKVLLTGVRIPRPSGSGITPDSEGLPFEVHRIKGDGGVELESWYIPGRQDHGLVGGDGGDGRRQAHGRVEHRHGGCQTFFEPLYPNRRPRPASFQARKPPSIWQTGSRPIF